MRLPKHKYYIMCNGHYVGESWAVSEEKACTNYWWKNDKKCNAYTSTNMSPKDYEAVKEK